MSRRVVLATFGSHGDVNPYLAVGKELRARGAQVVIATSEAYRADVEHCGLEMAPVRPDISADDEEMMRRVIDPWRGAEFLIRNLVVPNVEVAYDDLVAICDGADLLVSHVLAVSAPIVAAHTGIPWRSTVLSPMLFLSATDMPVMPPFTILKELRRVSPDLNRLARKGALLVCDSWCKPIFDLRRKLGLERGASPFLEGLHSPEGVLVMFSEVFARRQADWPAATTICGFPFLDQDFAESESEDLRGGSNALAPELEELLARGEPPVVFTLGSAAVKIAPDFFADALDAAARLGRACILVAGPAAEGLRRGRVPANVAIVSSVPYYLLFPRSSLLVHSGGIGTTGQSLRAGKPQIIIPFSHDQFDNAERVAALGCGRPFPRRRVTGRALAAVVAEVLARPRFMQAAEKVGALIRAENGVGAAADAILTAFSGQQSSSAASATRAS